MGLSGEPSCSRTLMGRGSRSTMVSGASSRFELHPMGPYSLEQSVKFLEGFAPAAYEGSGAGHLHLAFVLDGEEAAAGVCVRSEEGGVVGEVFGEADEMRTQVVRAQVARILSLDVDGGGFAEVGERDPVVGRLQERYPGLRPVCFNSPYEAAAWAVICNRIRITQAAKVKALMAQELGETVEIHGKPEPAFPGPERLMQLESFPGLSARKVEYLRGVACGAWPARLPEEGLTPSGCALFQWTKLCGS